VVRFRYYIQCISLGRRDGLIQLVDAHDRPHATVITGTAGARIKEQVVRGALRASKNTGPHRRFRP